ncbi:type II toxin-antitoxin system RelE/ParE family toxin [Vibrio parahaemolyticus]|uniref:type II toxin-antitoxin system RelE/ParE family toxin n=1 Tax=Vibrio parahaemolyticus TaxID=670 RepID=UPI00068F8173|nr:type II toxin-antitoxin system RelE/ParE family toxin [Vibrio parahaemolyticus]
MSAEIVYTNTFVNNIDERIHHLSQWNESTDAIIERLDSLIARFEGVVSEHAFSCQLCNELSQLGIYTVRQYTYDDFRILYEVDEDTNTVYALLLLGTKQNIQKALVDYCLLNR